MKQIDFYYVYNSQELLDEYEAISISEVEDEDFLSFIMDEENTLRLTKEELEEGIMNLSGYDSYVKVRIVEGGSINHSYTLTPKKNLRGK